MSGDRYDAAALTAVRDAVLAITSEIGITLDQMLLRLADAARDLVGARYAAIGVPDGEGGFSHFVAAGVDNATVAAIARCLAPTVCWGRCSTTRSRSFSRTSAATRASAAGPTPTPTWKRCWECRWCRAGTLNAGTLGPSPLPPLVDLALTDLERPFHVNVTAQLALVQALLPRLTDGGRILAITSDAAREAYPGWGAYGATKAALEQLMNVLTAEHPTLRIHRVDLGDLRTQMHQDAFPGEDISDRPEPDVAVPGLLRLLEEDLPSGRWPGARTEPGQRGCSMNGWRSCACRPTCRATSTVTVNPSATTMRLPRGRYRWQEFGDAYLALP